MALAMVVVMVMDALARRALVLALCISFTS
jgi:hypothetical protein